MADLKRRLFGYSSASVRLLLTERDAALDRASKNASEAGQRAERLSSELSETADRLAGVEEQLDAAQKLCLTLKADLERAVAERDSREAEALSLERQLRQQTERLEQATAEAEQSKASLQGALEESAEFRAAASAELSSVEPTDAQGTAGPSTAGELAAVIEVAERAVASIMESTRIRAEEELRTVDDERERISRDVETMTAWRDRAGPMIASLQAAVHEIQSQGAEIGRRVLDALRPVSTAVAGLNSQLASLDDFPGAPIDVSTEAAASEADDVMELPEEHPAGRDTSDW